MAFLPGGPQQGPTAPARKVQAYKPPAGSYVTNTSGRSGGSMYGGVNFPAPKANEITTPWEKAMQNNYGQAAQRPYASQWGSAVNQASQLGQKDYTGDMRRMAQEDVAKQNQSADNQLGALGMRELSLRADVQDDRSKALTDASTRAAIAGQGLQASGLEAMRSTLSAATGAELERVSQMIRAAAEGGAHYNQFQQIAIPLAQKMGLPGSPGPGPGRPRAPGVYGSLGRSWS